MSQMYGGGAIARNMWAARKKMNEPNDAQVEADRERYWAQTDQGTMGPKQNPPLPVGGRPEYTVYRPGPDGKNIPTYPDGNGSPSAAGNGNTRTAQGVTDPAQAKEILRQMDRRRRAVINGLLTGGTDPSQRQAAIAERWQIEDDMRSIGSGMPRTTVTPEGAQASREHLRGVLAKEFAERDRQPAPTYDTDPAYAAGIRGAPPSMTKPMADPRDELRRRQFARIAGNAPVLGGTIANPELTSPALQEAERRRMMDQEIIARRASRKTPEEVFPDVTPDEASEIDRRYIESTDRLGQNRERAADAMARWQNQQKAIRDLQAGQLDIAKATQAGDKAEQERRASGTDAASVEGKVRLAEAENKLAIARVQGSGAVEEADRTAPTANNIMMRDYVQRLETVMPEIVNPGISRAGWGGPEERDNTIQTVIGEIERLKPTLTPAQRVEYANRLRTLLFNVQESTSVFGRGDYRSKYVDQLRSLVDSLTVG